MCLLFSVPVLAEKEQSTLPKAPYISTQTVKDWQQEKKPVVFVDVREAKEFDAGHIEGAINMFYLDVEKRANEFKKDGTSYVFYCTYSAWRAPYAANSLGDQGFKNTYVLEGGITAWKSGGQVIYPSDVSLEAMIIPYAKDMSKALTHPPGRNAKVS